MIIFRDIIIRKKKKLIQNRSTVQIWNFQQVYFRSYRQVGLQIQFFPWERSSPVWRNLFVPAAGEGGGDLSPSRIEKLDMGAGGKFQYPKEVWSPAGGWWPYPKNWRSNTVACFVLLAGLCVPVFIASERLTVSQYYEVSVFRTALLSTFAYWYHSGAERRNHPKPNAMCVSFFRFPQVRYDKPAMPIPWRRSLGRRWMMKMQNNAFHQ